MDIRLANIQNLRIALRENIHDGGWQTRTVHTRYTNQDLFSLYLVVFHIKLKPLFTAASQGVVGPCDSRGADKVNLPCR